MPDHALPRWPLALAAVVVAGCGGGGHAAPKATPTPAARVVTATQAAQTKLGTTRDAIQTRFGRPLTRFAQPVAGHPTLDCLVYPGEGSSAYVRFCFRQDKLSAVSTMIGDDALKPTQPPKGGGKVTQLTPGQPAGTP